MRSETGASGLGGSGEVTTRVGRLHRFMRGSTLVPTMVFGAIMGISALAMVELGAYRTRAEYNRWSSNEAYYHAENALSWAVQKICDAETGGASAPFLGEYSITGGSLGLAYQADLKSAASGDFKDAWVTIKNHSSGVPNQYLVTTSAKVGKATRTIKATVQKWPPSLVFDYEYFLNNWGWWWGSTITGYGDNRANWDFDFKGSPTVNGAIYANGRVCENKVPVNVFGGSFPFGGTAKADPVNKIHVGTDRVTMPNLKDLTYYATKAANYVNSTGTKGSKLYVGATLVVDGVHNNAAKPGLYLQGTVANPIKIDGPVVVPGDVVISGPITGVGTLYVGNNLYIAGNVTYVNGPSFATPPTTLSQAGTDAWVQNAVTTKKDLVGFAVARSVLGGDVNSADWVNYCFNAADYGLKNVGNEANLGQDGIRGTPDDGKAYSHYVGDTLVNNASFDADGDGVIQANYVLATDITMGSARAGKIAGYPTKPDPADVTKTVLKSYSEVASNGYNRMDGIYYCNHAVACRMAASDVSFNGAVICRDEAIVFNDKLKFVYDPRVHSRYSNDPNRYIDLGLPVVGVRVYYMEEISPVEGFYAGL